MSNTPHSDGTSQRGNISQSGNAPQPRDVTAPRANAQSKWVCGYQRLGLECAEGPDTRGNCCQLRPDRARAVDNAVCHEQCSCRTVCELAKLRHAPDLPSHSELGPCLPQRAAWFSRQTLTLNFGILTAGLLLLSMTLPQREIIFVPGELSNAHSQILGNHLASERCSLCHPSSHADVTNFTIQDDLCLTCHTKHMSDAHLQSPHDLPREQLAKLTQKANPFAKLISNKSSIETNCASCHVEHRGASFDLTAISDASCQACHQQSFRSLSEGHPEFDGYPYRTERHIAFDHAAHEKQHFGTKNETFECRRCHIDERSSGELGPVFRSVSFEQACGSCHQQSIQAATINGWALMQLPSIDATDSQAPALGLTRWPAEAQFGYEGQIDVPLRLLLAGDPEMRETLAQLPASGKLLDIDDNDHRAAVARSLARGLQKLIREVSTDGQAVWQRRLQATASMHLQRELTAAELRLVEALSQGVPPDLFRQMQSTWFGMATEQVSHRSGAGGLHVSAAASHQVHPASKSNTLLIKDRSDDTQLTGASSDLLTGDSLSEDLLLDDDDSHALLGGDLPQATLPDSAEPKLAALQGSKHVSAGGWYLDHDLLGLRYMPRGHADPTLAAWAEYIALIDAAPSPAHHLTHGVGVPGDCMQCHLLHPRSDSLDFVARWTSASGTPSVRPFTKFDHRPHLTLPALDDCRYCHQFSDQGATSLAGVFAEQMLTGSRATEPQQMTQAACQFLRDEFIDMQRQQCSACHRPGGASDSCTQCHNYHVGSNPL